MKYAAIALLWSLVSLTAPVLAQTGSPPAATAEARSETTPRARVRGYRQGLSPEGFAQWRKDNAALAGIGRDDLDRPDQLKRDFTAADTNGDHMISAVELADWISSRPALAQFRDWAPGESISD